MSVFLFDDIIFGPVRSRRLGLSLGINLLPAGHKVCTFDCIYCECGWTHHSGDRAGFPPAAGVLDALGKRLEQMKGRGQSPDAITFAGNGEPTLHPEFAGIMDGTIELRKRHFPSARVCVLSNASRLKVEEVAAALRLADLNMLKLDAGTDETFRKLNQPRIRTDLETIISDISGFDGEYIIQSMFVRGEAGGSLVDNSTDEEVGAWIMQLKRLRPQVVMIYSLDRGTPVADVEAVSQERLHEIARRVGSVTGLATEVY